MKYKINNNIISINNEISSITIEFLENNILHIYKNKEVTLVPLHEKPSSIKLSVIENDELVTIRFNNYAIFVFQDLKYKILDLYKNTLLESYPYDATLKSFNKNFDLAALEGHKKTENVVKSKTQINYYLPKGSYLYGLGDKCCFLNKYGYEFISYNTDDPSPQNENFPSLYKSINFLLLNTSESNYVGIYYPSTYKTFFNLGKYKQDLLFILSQDGEYDNYIFLGTIKEIIASYSSLVGRPSLPRLKMLGNQQSRRSYASKQEVEEVVKGYEEAKMPLDYIHLDIDYMDKYKVFTVDDEKFPNFKDFVSELKNKNFDVVTIIDPAVKVEDNYYVYEDLKKNGFAKLDGKNYVNVVWPGDSVYPNYFDKNTSKYFTNLVSTFISQGISGIWTDMNEPASFKGPLPDNVEFKIGNTIHYHKEIHNIYADYMIRSFYKGFLPHNLRPFLITRAAFSTTSSMSTTWNGDNCSLWSHLKASIPQILSMNISSYPFNGVDIGGFGADTTKELLIRWIEANIFSMFLRNHSSLNTRSQEPYAFDDETANIYRKYLNLRYDFVPYLYDLMFEANRYGTIPLRPLFYNYPDDSLTKEINDELMIGDSLLYAPILDQGMKERSVYLPQGKWINYFTNETYVGNKSYVMKVPLQDSLLFVKDCSIIPQYKNLMHINKKEIDTLHLYVTPHNGKCTTYEDDGSSLDALKGKYNKYSIRHTGNKVIFKTIKNGYVSDYKFIIINYKTKQIKLPFSYNFTAELD